MGIDPRRADSEPRHAQALEQILTACRNTGKIAGLACAGPEDARRRGDQGWRFLTAGGDSGFLLGGAQAGLKVLGLLKA
jgi:2-keto-3-deoxy-L-rhamnonate aldolase RhmA